MRTHLGVVLAASLSLSALVVATISRGQPRTEATGDIVCTVLDGATLKGIGGVKVKLRRDDDSEEDLGITDASGKKVKKNVPVGPVEIVFYKRHYVRETQIVRVIVKKGEAVEVAPELVNNRGDAAYYQKLVDVIASRGSQGDAAFDAAWKRLKRDQLHPFGLAAVAGAISKKGGQHLPIGQDFESYRSLDEQSIAALALMRAPSSVGGTWSKTVATNATLPAIVKRDAAAAILTDQSISTNARLEVLAGMKRFLPRNETKALLLALDLETRRELEGAAMAPAAAAPTAPAAAPEERAAPMDVEF